MTPRQQRVVGALVPEYAVVPLRRHRVFLVLMLNVALFVGINWFGVLWLTGNWTRAIADPGWSPGGVLLSVCLCFIWAGSLLMVFSSGALCRYKNFAELNPQSIRILVRRHGIRVMTEIPRCEIEHASSYLFYGIAPGLAALIARCVPWLVVEIDTPERKYVARIKKYLIEETEEEMRSLMVALERPEQTNIATA